MSTVLEFVISHVSTYDLWNSVSTSCQPLSSYLKGRSYVLLNQQNRLLVNYSKKAKPYVASLRQALAPVGKEAPLLCGSLTALSVITDSFFHAVFEKTPFIKSSNTLKTSARLLVDFFVLKSVVRLTALPMNHVGVAAIVVVAMAINAVWNHLQELQSNLNSQSQRLNQFNDLIWGRSSNSSEEVFVEGLYPAIIGINQRLGEENRQVEGSKIENERNIQDLREQVQSVEVRVGELSTSLGQKVTRLAQMVNLMDKKITEKAIEPFGVISQDNQQMQNIIQGIQSKIQDIDFSSILIDVESLKENSRDIKAIQGILEESKQIHSSIEERTTTFESNVREFINKLLGSNDLIRHLNDLESQLSKDIASANRISSSNKSTVLRQEKREAAGKVKALTLDLNSVRDCKKIINDFISSRQFLSVSDQDKNPLLNSGTDANSSSSSSSIVQSSEDPNSAKPAEVVNA